MKKLEAARDRIDFEQENIEDSLMLYLKETWVVNIIFFRMINGELVPID
ncbi:MAG: hypothetical protein R2807_10190 [Chitinophagales bacterium]